MHEEDTRLLRQHMTVQRCNLDAVRPQRFDHWVDFIAGDHEIAGDRSLATARWLEIDRVGRAHRGWHRHAILGNRIAPWHVELIDAAIDRAFGADDLVELRRVEVDCRRGRWR